MAFGPWPIACHGRGFEDEGKGEKMSGNVPPPGRPDREAEVLKALRAAGRDNPCLVELPPRGGGPPTRPRRARRRRALPRGGGGDDAGGRGAGVRPRRAIGRAVRADGYFGTAPCSRRTSGAPFPPLASYNLRMPEDEKAILEEALKTFARSRVAQGPFATSCLGRRRSGRTVQHGRHDIPPLASGQDGRGRGCRTP